MSKRRDGIFSMHWWRWACSLNASRAIIPIRLRRALYLDPDQTNVHWWYVGDDECPAVPILGRSH